jgi:pilus assembly protein CpaB
MGPSRRAAWRRHVLRRGVAGACLVLAGWLVVAERVGHGEQVRVLVATHNVTAGEMLTDDHVAVVPRPREVTPDTAAARPDEVVGRVAAVAIVAGEVLTPSRVGGTGLLAGLPTGEVAVPVPLLDATALGLVGAGDRVDLYRAGASTPAVLGALVLQASGAADDAVGGLGGGGAAPMIVVAVNSVEVGRLMASRDPTAPVSGYAVALRRP